MQLRDLLDRLRGRRRTTTHRAVKVKMSVPASGLDADALAREVEAEVARQLAAGDDPAAIEASLEDIAQRRGGKVDGFEET